MKKKEIYVQRLNALRREMKKQNIDAYLIVSEDFHGSEYVGDYFKCREYISGFDGSAGSLLIMEEEAGLWTDGRYFIQAAEQLEGTGIRLQKMGEDGVPTIVEFLVNNMKDGQCLGYDGRTISYHYAEKIKKALQDKKISFVEDIDLVGDIWEERPAMSCEPVWVLEDSLVGMTRREKLNKLREKMREEGAQYHLLTSLDDIAWLYNIRGNDIAYNPVVLSHSLIDEKGENTFLYVNPDAVDKDVEAILLQDGIKLKPYLQIYEDLKTSEMHSLMVDESCTNVAFMSAISPSVRVIGKENPTRLWKAVKTHEEIENERMAHRKDGVAVTKLIYWLKSLEKTDAFSKQEITEQSVGEHLLSLRQEQEGFLEQSFAPIIATGAHGAIVHYESTDETNIPIENNTFLLMDTGGQYYQGTTDITRTVGIGQLTKQQKEHYTAVLRGNLNLAAARFKYGCAGGNLDYLARSPLWESGLDYNHGTGHGVGYLLNVHEGPNAIRLKNGDGSVGAVLEEGMITSDEPGLYLEHQYGIRLENLILCKKAEKTSMGQFMEFETLTMVPFDRDAILPDCMSEKEKEWLDAYHARVYENISPYLDEDEKQWLYEVTRPIDDFSDNRR